MSHFLSPLPLRLQQHHSRRLLTIPLPLLLTLLLASCENPLLTEQNTDEPPTADGQITKISISTSILSSSYNNALSNTTQTLTNTQGTTQTLPNTQGTRQSLSNTQGTRQSLSNSECTTQTLPNTQGTTQTLPNTQGTRQSLSESECTRLDIAIYRNSTLLLSSKQEADKEGFGSFNAELEIGTQYQVVAIAHSGEKAMTMTKIEKIAPPSPLRVTDTFWAYQEFTAEEGMQLNLELKRVVAMVRFGIMEPTPQEVASIDFNYKGGSSTLNGITGVGCVNSNQTEPRTVLPEAYEGSSSYQLFTYPRNDSNELELEVKALTPSTVLYKRTSYSGVPIKRNAITDCSGCFFTGSSTIDPVVDTDSTSTFFLSIDTDWEEPLFYNY